MGDLAFGKSFNMLIDGKDAYILKQLHADMKGIGLFSHLTWLFPFFKKIPVINAEYLKFWKWVDGRVYERIQVRKPPLNNLTLKAGRLKFKLLIRRWSIEYSRSPRCIFMDPQGI